MSLMRIRLELGRTEKFPHGNPGHGYEFLAPLAKDGHIDAKAWREKKENCTVRYFRPGHDDEEGLLRHIGQGWRFDFDPSQTSDDEPFFKLDRHVISPGYYVSLTEHDGVEKPFKIVSVTPIAKL